MSEALPLVALEETPSLVDRPRTGGHGLPPPPAEDRSEGGPGGLAADPARFGLFAFLGTVSMMFIGFSSAYLIRRTAADWRPLSPPSIMWWNTAALLASSALLQVSRRRFGMGDAAGGRSWLSLSGLLGLTFLAGQVATWRLLSSQGVTVASNPHSSFLYVLAGVHAAHLLGGLFWFAAVRVRLRHPSDRGASPVGPRVRRGGSALFADPVRLLAVYWHFLGALWLYLLLLVFVF